MFRSYLHTILIMIYYDKEIMMFGYIVINKPEMKFKDFDIYQSYYCGLCRTINDNYGLKGRVALNYDMTFLAILLSGLYEPHNQSSYRRCFLHPLKKHLEIQNEYVEYAAKMTIALTYLKCDDDWIDDQKISKQVYKKILNHSYQSIKKEFPQKMDMIEKQLDKIHEYEKMKDVRIDDISGCFGKVMAEICCFQDDLWQDYLREFGFFLGKYIYLLDAYDDIEKDLKDNNYNPFISHFHDEHFEERCHDLLEMMISRAAEAFEYLPIEENVEILRNIIYSGVWSQYELRYQKRMEDKK